MSSAEEIIKSLELFSGTFLVDLKEDAEPGTGAILILAGSIGLMQEAAEMIKEQKLTNQSLVQCLLDHGIGPYTPLPDDPSPAPEANDPVNHPDHYTQGGVEGIDALKAATMGLKGIEAVCTANAIKYLWRWKQKNGAEDLRKAVWYIHRLIDEAEARDETEQ